MNFFADAISEERIRRRLLPHNRRAVLSRLGKKKEENLVKPPWETATVYRLHKRICAPPLSIFTNPVPFIYTHKHTHTYMYIQFKDDGVYIRFCICNPCSVLSPWGDKNLLNIIFFLSFDVARLPKH